MSEFRSELHQRFAITLQGADQTGFWFVHYSSSNIRKNLSVTSFLASSMWSAQKHNANSVLIDALVFTVNTCLKEGQ